MTATTVYCGISQIYGWTFKYKSCNHSVASTHIERALYTSEVQF